MKQFWNKVYHRQRSEHTDTHREIERHKRIHTHTHHSWVSFLKYPTVALHFTLSEVWNPEHNPDALAGPGLFSSGLQRVLFPLAAPLSSDTAAPESWFLIAASWPHLVSSLHVTFIFFSFYACLWPSTVSPLSWGSHVCGPPSTVSPLSWKSHACSPSLSPHFPWGLMFGEFMESLAGKALLEEVYLWGGLRGFIASSTSSSLLLHAVAGDVISQRSALAMEEYPSLPGYRLSLEL